MPSSSCRDSLQVPSALAAGLQPVAGNRTVLRHKFFDAARPDCYVQIMAPELSPLNQRFVAEALAEGLFPSREALLDRAIDLLRLSLDFDELPQPAPPSTAVDPAATPAESIREVAVDEGRKNRLEAWDSDSWDSDAVMRRIFESLAEAGVRTND